MDTRELLATIILRCPDLAHQAAGALRAHETHSPIAHQRVIAVIADAVRLYGGEFADDERAALDNAARVAAGGTPARTLDVRVRVNADEKARVQALADEAGQSVSDYIRQRIGL